MPTVTLADPIAPASAPDSGSVSTALAEGVVISDSTGRRLKLKRPTLVMESRLIRLLGESAESTVYLNAYVLPAVMVVGIDDDECLFPMTVAQLEAQIQRVGREGMQAVIQYITSAPSNPEKETADIKK